MTAVEGFNGADVFLHALKKVIFVGTMNKRNSDVFNGVALLSMSFPMCDHDECNGCWYNLSFVAIICMIILASEAISGWLAVAIAVIMTCFRFRSN